MIIGRKALGLRSFVAKFSQAFMRPIWRYYELGEQMEPDFTKYSLDELKDVESVIDRIQYPERYELVKKLIAEKSVEVSKTQKPELEKEEALRELHREYKNQKSKVWKIFRGATLMFVTFRVMQYLDWTIQQQIIGVLVVFCIYTIILVGLNEYQFNKFKRNFGKRT